MSKITPEYLKKYIGSWVNIKQGEYYTYINERVVRVEGDQLVTEYFHTLKTPEDGLLRDHWIPISNIDAVELR